MKKFEQITEQEFEKIAADVESLSQRDEDEIYQIIGSALDLSEDIGEVPDNLNFMSPRKYDPIMEKADLMSNAMGFMSTSMLRKKRNTAKDGKKFWIKFKKKLKKAICSNKDIKKIITNQGTVKEYIKVGIPIIMAAMGISALNPAILLIIASVFALIIKVGFEVYCEIK